MTIVTRGIDLLRYLPLVLALTGCSSAPESEWSALDEAPDPLLAALANLRAERGPWRARVLTTVRGRDLPLLVVVQRRPDGALASAAQGPLGAIAFTWEDHTRGAPRVRHNATPLPDAALRSGPLRDIHLRHRLPLPPPLVVLQHADGAPALRAGPRRGAHVVYEFDTHTRALRRIIERRGRRTLAVMQWSDHQIDIVRWRPRYRATVHLLEQQSEP